MTHVCALGSLARFLMSGIFAFRVVCALSWGCVLCVCAVLSAGKAVAKVVAGDNAAESAFARSKNQLRRIGKLGRMSPKTSHIDVLAVRRLLEKPRLATCIARKSRAGQLGHAPGDAYDSYDITKDKEWLSTCRDK